MPDSWRLGSCAKPVRHTARGSSCLSRSWPASASLPRYAQDKTSMSQQAACFFLMLSVFFFIFAAHHCQGMLRTKRRCLSKLRASSSCCLSSSSSLLRIIAKVCSGPNVGWGASFVLLLDVVCLLLRCASLKPNCWSSNLASQRIIKAKLLE